MLTPNDENFIEVEDETFYLLVGEKQGVAADESAILEDTSDERIIIAHSVEELTDERVSIIFPKPSR